MIISHHQPVIAGAVSNNSMLNKLLSMLLPNLLEEAVSKTN